MIPFCKVTTFFFSLFLKPMENFYNFHIHKCQRIIGIRKVGLIDLWKIFVPTMENGSESPYYDSRIINGTAIQYQMSDGYVDPQLFSGFS